MNTARKNQCSANASSNVVMNKKPLQTVPGIIQDLDEVIAANFGKWKSIELCSEGAHCFF